MTQQELANLLVWVFTIGIPGAIAAYARIAKRQNENRKNIAVQAKVTEEVKTDHDKRFDDLVSTIGILQEKIDTQDEKIRVGNANYEQLNKEVIELRSELAAKDQELKIQLELNRKVSVQLEDERKSHTALGSKYSELEDKYQALEKRVSDMNIQMEKQAAIIETYNRIIPLLQTTVPKTEVTELPKTGTEGR